MTLTTVTRPQAKYPVEFVSFDELRSRMEWEQGQHVALIGPTGRGKTTLIKGIIPEREYVIFLGTKRKDETQDDFKKLGFKTIPDSKQLSPELGSKYLVKPPFPEKMSAAELKAFQSHVFEETLMRAYRQGAWTVVADELRYLTDTLGLSDEVELLLMQGRSQGNTVISGVQRPRHVPLLAYDQAMHRFFWRDGDESNVDRQAELTGLNKKLAREVIPNLEGHDFLYHNDLTGELLVSNAKA